MISTAMIFAKVVATVFGCCVLLVALVVIFITLNPPKTYNPEEAE